MATQNQFQLFKTSRFAPYFGTQFLGALNDNIYKNALLTIIAFGSLAQDTREVLTNLGAILFILPFFIFSALAGQLADKYVKAHLIRVIKFAEIIIMTTGVFAIASQNMTLLFIVLFFMGMQSSFFAPVKYSILPQYLEEVELIGGNGLVEMGTFVAILLGTIFGIVLIRLTFGGTFVSIGVVLVAIVGFLCSLKIPPHLKSANPNLKMNWNPITQTWYTLKRAASQRTVFLTILGISWFWFFGAILITQLYNYNRDIIMGDEVIMVVMICLTSIGIAVGSLSCEKLCGHKVEIGLVPIGSLFLTLITIDLSFAHAPPPAEMIHIGQFLTQGYGWHILIDLFLIGFFGGIYSVPLYVLLQSRTLTEERSQMVAANSIMNALFMVMASVFAIIMLKLGLNIPQLILVLGFLNLAVTLYIYKLLPEFIMRMIAWLLVNIIYRVKIEGLDQIPDEGPAVITCNHVSFVDPIVIMACCRRPIRFVMDHQIFKIPILKFVFKTAKCIPVAPAKEDPSIKEKAFESVKEGLHNGDLIGLFPEGGLTNDGTVKPFRPGLSRILTDSPVPVVPLALTGLWGSFFSRRYGKAMAHWPRHFLFKKIGLVAGKPIHASNFDLKTLQDITEDLISRHEVPEDSAKN